MIEIRVQLDEIDYTGIAELAMPIIKEKLGENGDGFLSGLVGKRIPSFALGSLMKFLTPKQKDEIALKLINKYEAKIAELLEKTASEHGVSLKIKGVSAKNADGNA